jgi:hypothetical protein
MNEIGQSRLSKVSKPSIPSVPAIILPPRPYAADVAVVAVVAVWRPAAVAAPPTKPSFCLMVQHFLSDALITKQPLKTFGHLMRSRDSVSFSLVPNTPFIV